MNNLIPTDRSALSRDWRIARFNRQTDRAIASVDHRTLVRMATVEGEGLVQGTKLKEVDHLTRAAMSGHAMLHTWAGVLAHGDPFMADDLKFFTDMSRMGKGEIIADTIDTFCRESRRA